MKLDLSKINNEELFENLEFLISDYAVEFKNISNKILGVDKKGYYFKKISKFKFYENLFNVLISLNNINKSYKMFLKEAKRRKIINKSYYKKDLSYILMRN